MNILISVNISYYDAARIMLRSLFHNNINCKIVVYLFHTELGVNKIKSLRRLAEQNGGLLHDIKINDEIMKNVPIGNLSKETYYRLMAPKLLPVELDRILYLDIDMIVTGDIQEIYQVDFQDNLFMAVRDTSLGVDIIKKNLHMKKESIYINAGVLLMNLNLLRKEFHLEKALGFAIRFPERVPCCDQDVINGLYYDRIGYLNWKFNYEARFHSVLDIFVYPFKLKQLMKEIRIIHYMGQEKPWKPGFNGKFLKEYNYYAKHTAYEKEIKKNIQFRFWYLIKLITFFILKLMKKEIMKESFIV